MIISTRPAKLSLLIIVLSLLANSALIGREAPGMSRIKRAMEMTGQAAHATIKQLPSSEMKKKKRKKKQNTDDATESRFAKLRKQLFSEMSYEDLYKTRDLVSASKNRSTFIKYTEQLIKLCPDMDQRATLILELADALFDDGKLEKAADQYATFNMFYPGHNKTEYALYRAVLSSFYRILSADRDQTKTKDAIEFANTFLKETKFTAYRDEVQKIKTQCYQRLIESELYVCDFYINKGRFKAVEQRIKTIQDDMLTEAPSMESQLLSMQAHMNEEKDLLENPPEKTVKPTLRLAQGKGAKRTKLAKADKASDKKEAKSGKKDRSIRFARRF